LVLALDAKRARFPDPVLASIRTGLLTPAARSSRDSRRSGSTASRSTFNLPSCVSQSWTWFQLGTEWATSSRPHCYSPTAFCGRGPLKAASFERGFAAVAPCVASLRSARCPAGATRFPTSVSPGAADGIRSDRASAIGGRPQP